VSVLALVPVGAFVGVLSFAFLDDDPFVDLVVGYFDVGDVGVIDICVIEVVLLGVIVLVVVVVGHDSSCNNYEIRKSGDVLMKGFKDVDLFKEFRLVVLSVD
jgi:hypothetical protein